jgi:hypothetical protein
MVRILAGAVLMIVMFYLGAGIEKYYKRRHEIYKDFYDFLQYASREIGFLKTDIISIIENFGNEKSGNFIKILNSVKDCVQKGLDIKVETSYLNANEKLAVVSFFNSLSKSDFTEQEKLFNRYKLETGDKLKTAEKQKKEKGELYKKLFILGGVGLLIIVI